MFNEWWLECVFCLAIFSVSCASLCLHALLCISILCAFENLDCTVLVSVSWHDGSNTFSTRSPVIVEESMIPGHWLRLLLFAPFTALTLMVGWQEGHLASIALLIPRSSVLEQLEEEDPQVEEEDPEEESG